MNRHSPSRPSNLPRRTLVAAVASALLAGPGLALAQPSDPASGYPSQPIRFIIPATAGGGTDVVTRLIAKYMTEAWNSPVLVENRAGAGGVIAAQYVSTQKPDGYTFLAIPSAFGVRSAIDPKLPYDPNTDLTGVAMLGRGPLLVAVHPSRPERTLQEVIAAGRSATSSCFNPKVSISVAYPSASSTGSNSARCRFSIKANSKTC
jgi:tripartite-type tricarboxylate transporter receptor subunit TctC